MEEEIEKSRGNRVDDEDVSLWLNGKGVCKRSFSSTETWEFIRERKILIDWADIVWFKYSTPKYSFILWLAMRGRLATGDRMRAWQCSAREDCILCNAPLETLEHLFFECSYSTRVWEALMKGILRGQFTVRWEEIKRLMRGSMGCKMQSFLVKYMFQATVYMLWRERNRQRHREATAPAELLIKLLDKNMRNKLTLIQRKGDKVIGNGM